MRDNVFKAMEYCGHTVLEITELDDHNEADKWRKEVQSHLKSSVGKNGLYNDPLMVDAAWAKSQGYIIGVRFRNMENSCSAGHENFDHIAQAFRVRGFEHIYGLCTEGDLESLYIANTSAEGLMQLYWETRVFSSGLFLPDFPFIILLTYEYFDVFAGEPAFVRDCLNGSTVEAAASFEEFIKDSVYSYMQPYIDYARTTWTPDMR